MTRSSSKDQGAIHNRAGGTESKPNRVRVGLLRKNLMHSEIKGNHRSKVNNVKNKVYESIILQRYQQSVMDCLIIAIATYIRAPIKDP